MGSEGVEAETMTVEGEEPVLPCVRKVLDGFHEAGVRYCHWKSNEHVLAGMQGKTDLDILVDHSQRDLCTQVMMEAGYKRFQSVGASAYPGIEDHIALDIDSLRLSHLHVHYRLVVGEKHLKGYRLPWEQDLLESRRLNPKLKIYTARAEMELVLLLVRMALKFRTRDKLRRLIRRSRVGLDDQREFAWLVERVDTDLVREIGQSWLGPRVNDKIHHMLHHRLTAKRVMHLRRPVRLATKDYRYYGRWQARRLRWGREIGVTSRAIARRVGLCTNARRRVLPHGGVVIALLGVDGAGKSTQTTSLAQVLSKKLDVVTIYFGSGDGRTSILLSVLKWMGRRVKRRRHRTSKKSGINSSPRSPSILRVPIAIAVAFEKRKNLRKANRARSLGLIVFTDRFPQAQNFGYNDGPLLAWWLQSSGGLRRRIAQWELRQYEASHRFSPDLVFKLMLPPHVALQRKPDTAKIMVARKIEAIQGMQFPPTTTCVTVDASQRQEAVLKEIAGAVWEQL